MRRKAGLKNNLTAKLMSIDGLIPNASVAICHCILILIVPVFTPIITFLALCEMTTISKDIYARPITFYDFYATNKLDPWWNNTPYITIAAYIHIYVLVYLFFAFVELISFYLTGLDNQGKFPVRYSFVKKFFMYCFYALMGFFCFLYVAMLWFAFVWAVLAGVLNPSVFLPYTAAALTLIATITAKYAYFKAKFDDLYTNFEAVVKEKLGELLLKSLEKIKDTAKPLTGNKLDNLGPKNMEEAQNALTKGFDKLSIMGDANATDLKAIILDDITSMAESAAYHIDGINPAIIELIAAIIAKNNAHIGNAIRKIGDSLSMDGELLKIFATLAINDFNPSSIDKQKSFGIAENEIKKLFRKLVPDLPIGDRIGDICSVVLRKDPTPILKCLESILPDNEKTQ